MIAFFHQNEPLQTTGGIEAYVTGMLAAAAPLGGVLVTEDVGQTERNRIGVRFARGCLRVPRWLNFTLMVWLERRRLCAALDRAGVKIVELSRADYWPMILFLRRPAVVTIHGIGASHLSWHRRILAALPYIACALLVRKIFIAGSDRSALPRLVRERVAKKTITFSNWYSDCFLPVAPQRFSCLRVFYAGRLGKEKRPDLMAQIVSRLVATSEVPVEFNYFGPDGDILAHHCGPDLPLRMHGRLAPSQLAAEIARCHIGLLCSDFEGSPFIVIETLACGRPMVVSDIDNLRAEYAGNPGVFFVRERSVEAFVCAILDAYSQLQSVGDYYLRIANGVSARSKGAVTQALLRAMVSSAPCPKS